MMGLAVWCVISTSMVISYVCLQLCSAQALTCTVTQDDDGLTVYNISEVSRASDIKASDCHYSWTNTTNHVLANQKEKTSWLVRRNSINILVTTECFDEMIFTRNCVSEVIERTANCAANCSIMKIKEDKTKIQKHEMSRSLITAVLILLLVGLFGLLLLACKFKERIKRVCSCGNYSAVMKDDSKHVVVEARNL